ncbi:class I adenylate-forming enzyme family protein [Streptomyces sp. ok210]|jgi:acyl-coenzyme A synthetase/AMP-(fatty) acid ligase|uniref:class I adenylate-forming enzyme family protein n=1 Tax=Streptomyces sp. ok210 TaxID=1761905 RepID=UPI0008F24CFE|nr:class I adenylate-forming enzyme family protein [Streptomyces sp. ok210]SFT31370.1 Acyl-CoA synthetase (AMP-forming)/AMP-acid ligase II [Streptomyces sp. ok210]
MTALYQAVRDIARRRPTAIAVETTTGERTPYAELLAAADRVAEGLRGRGVAEGHVVFCSGLANDASYIAFLLGVCAAGAAYVPLLADFDAAAVARAVRLTRPVLWIGPENHHHAGVTVPRVELADLSVPSAPVPADAAPPERAFAPGTFRMLWTSGSTKAPKLVTWRQEPFVRERRRWIAHIEATEDDAFFCRHTLDVAHATDLHAFAALLVGARLVLADPDAEPATLLAQLAATGATYTSMLPNHYKELIAAAGQRPSTDLSRLRRPMCGGAYASPALIASADEVLGIRIRHIYGSTEFGLALGNMADEVQTIGGIHEVAGVRARLEPFAGHDRDDLGSLVLTSDCTSDGYLDDDEANAATFRGPDFWTGDVAQRLDDGRFRVLGRVTDMLMATGGPLPTPFLDELIVRDCPVAESVSLAADTDSLTNRVLVVLRAAPGTSDDEAVGAVDKLLASHGLTGAVLAFVRIPRTVVGKADRALLRRRYLTALSFS